MTNVHDLYSAPTDLIVPSSTDMAPPAVVDELFRFNSGTAYDLNTLKMCHPMDVTGRCVIVIAAVDSKGNAVLLIDANPSKDRLKNWNTGKYKYTKVSGTEVRDGSDIPQEFSNLENFYKGASRAIVVRSVEPIPSKSGRPANEPAVSHIGVARPQALYADISSPRRVIL